MRLTNAQKLYWYAKVMPVVSSADLCKEISSSTDFDDMYSQKTPASEQTALVFHPIAQKHWCHSRVHFVRPLSIHGPTAL